jgi:hypothetical protein
MLANSATRAPYGESTVGEQPELGLEIGLHVAIVVEVIVAQVGESRHIEVDAVDAKLGEGLRRNL